MYALAINGSPRKGGNTEILLQNVLEPLVKMAWRTKLIQVGGTVIHGCMACGQCRERQNLQCAITTDMLNEIFAEMLQADAIILGSPTYFTDVTSEMKALLDRAGYVSIANGRVFRGKIGAAVVAARRAGAVHVYDTINHMFLINQMIVPGSSYWNLGLGREKGEVEGDAEALANMHNLGETIGWLGTAIAPHLANMPKI
jgi:multimeric flavodoxin WrbA